MSKATKNWVMASPWVFGVMALLLAAVFGAVALSSGIGSMGVFALMLAGAGVWNLSVAVRMRAAAKRGATPVSHLTGGDSVGTGFSAPATQSNPSGSRAGVVVIVDAVAAFVPTSEWRGPVGGVLAAAASTHASNVVMLQVPQSVGALHALVLSSQGFYLDDAWRWSAPGRVLTRQRDSEFVTVRLLEPYANLWRQLELESDRVDALTRRIALGVTASGLALGGVGALAWRLTGNIEFLQAGVGYALVAGIASVLVVKRLRAMVTPD